METGNRLTAAGGKWGEGMVKGKRRDWSKIMCE